MRLPLPGRAACVARLVLLAGLLVPLRAQALQVESSGLSTAEAAASQVLAEGVLARLPPPWREALPAGLRLQWRDDLPEHVAGRARGTRIRLPRRLLQVPPAEAQAALVHELAHVFDRSPQGGLSREPRLRDLAGWQKQPLKLWRTRNAFTDRSPDRYELENPREFVAVNLEHYLLDPGYACRRPQLAAWFDARFGVDAPPHGCAPALPYVQAEGGNGAVSLLDLAPARVYAVDYLLAEGNARAMSRWGHSMLRLVVCAPERAPGPDCRMDLQHHRVLSFRAFVDDVQISSLRGLTGAYPSRLFVLPLNQVVDEYTQVELRDLVSIPLALERDEIGALLQNAARVHWSYDGRYYFIGNNCAVETFKLLHDGVPRLAAADLASITPRGLLEKLERAGLADARVLDDREAAVRAGHRFESAALHYQTLLDAARSRLPLPVAQVEQWFALPARQREPWMQQGDLNASAALYLLEQAAQRRQELLARDFLKRLLLGGKAGAQDALAQVRGLIDAAGVLTRPAMLLDGAGGYGLPQAQEQAALQTQLASRNAALVSGWPALWQQARKRLPREQREEWDAIEANLDTVGTRMRRLAAEQALAS